MVQEMRKDWENAQNRQLVLQLEIKTSSAKPTRGMEEG
jgi:hypothetical protein